MIESDGVDDGSTALPLVIDTNVCLDLFLFADSAVASLHQQLRRAELRAYYSHETRDEWCRVLGYAVWKLDEQRQQRLREAFDRLLVRWDLEEPHFAGLAPPICRDPDDQKFLQLAAALPACVLISKDRDLLKLARGCRRRLGFAILSPVTWAAMDAVAIEDLYAELRLRRQTLASPGF